MNVNFQGGIFSRSFPWASSKIYMGKGLAKINIDFYTWHGQNKWFLEFSLIAFDFYIEQYWQENKEHTSD